MIRVVQINAVPYGSTGRLAMDIHRMAGKNGAQSLFIYTKGDSPVEAAVRIGTDIDQKLHAGLSRITGLQGYWSWRQTKKILERFEEFQPQIVHLHNLHTNSINFPMLFHYLASKKIRVCLTLHDCFFFTGHCCYYTEVNCSRWQSNCGHCPLLRSYNSSLFFDTSRKELLDKQAYFASLDRLAVIGVSRWASEEAKRSILATASIHDYIYNWIDQSTFKPKKSPKPSEVGDRFMILGVSDDWNDRKGLTDFLRLANKLPEDAVIVLVGRCAHKLPDNIIHIKHTDNAESLAELYSAADVFVHLSKQETFGLVTAEALSCGTPAIVYNNTASPELVGEGCGTVCSNGNTDEVLSAIKAIKEAGKGNYIEQCRQHALEYFSPEENISRYYDVYNRLLKD